MTAPPRAAHPRRALAVLCTGLFLIGLDVSVMNVALPSLQSSDLDPGPQGLLWMAVAYTLALACCVPPAGVWSDTHGRRRAFTLGLALCGTASAGGRLATGTGQVVAARLAMGCGAALLMPSTLSLITVVFPDPAARRKAVAAWTFVAGLGALAFCDSLLDQVRPSGNGDVAMIALRTPLPHGSNDAKCRAHISRAGVSHHRQPCSHR